MTILLQFDLFYTIIRIPNIFSDLAELEGEFISWVYTTDDCLKTFDDGTYVYFYDDNTFIEWLKSQKSVRNEDIKIIVSHSAGYHDDSINVDGVMCF